MNAWDVFVAFMFIVLISPLATFTYIYWREERRRKQDNKIAVAYANYNDANRLYRKWR